MMALGTVIMLVLVGYLVDFCSFAFDSFPALALTWCFFLQHWGTNHKTLIIINKTHHCFCRIKHSILIEKVFHSYRLECKSKFIIVSLFNFKVIELLLLIFKTLKPLCSWFDIMKSIMNWSSNATCNSLFKLKYFMKHLENISISKKKGQYNSSSKDYCW